jgi:hypothetical protein
MSIPCGDGTGMRVPQLLVNIAHTGKAKRTKSISSREPRGFFPQK